MKKIICALLIICAALQASSVAVAAHGRREKNRSTKAACTASIEYNDHPYRLLENEGALYLRHLASPHFKGQAWGNLFVSQILTIRDGAMWETRPRGADPAEIFARYSDLNNYFVKALEIFEKRQDLSEQQRIEIIVMLRGVIARKLSATELQIVTDSSKPHNPRHMRVNFRDSLDKKLDELAEQI